MLDKRFYFFLQHPDKDWKKFAAGLPELKGTKNVLFTDHELMTGSTFVNMAKHLYGKAGRPSLELKSRNGKLSGGDKRDLDTLTGITR